MSFPKNRSPVTAPSVSIPESCKRSTASPSAAGHCMSASRWTFSSRRRRRPDSRRTVSGHSACPTPREGDSRESDAYSHALAAPRRCGGLYCRPALSAAGPCCAAAVGPCRPTRPERRGRGGPGVVAHAPRPHARCLDRAPGAHLSLSRFLSGMMRLSHHNTVTGGTTHGRYTVHRPTVPPDGVPGCHQPDAQRVSAARLALRDRVPHPDGRMADGWETPDRAPVYRLQQLPPPNTRKRGFPPKPPKRYSSGIRSLDELRSDR